MRSCSALDPLDDQGLAHNPLQHRLGILLTGKAVARVLECHGAVAGQQFPERLGVKHADLVIAAGDHGEDWRLHPADAQEKAAAAVADGVIAGGIEPHDPIGLAAAACRRVECVEVGQRSKTTECLSDRGIGQ